MIMTIKKELRREMLIPFSTRMKGLAVLTLSVLSGIGLEVRAAQAEKSPANKAAINPQGGKLHLKVDLALPTSATDPTPVPGTLKPGWSPFVATRWRDMYMHDGVWEDGSTCGGPPPKAKGIAGSGVHVVIDCVRGGNGGFAVFGMERDNLGGGGEPKGEPKGEPIANGWFHNVDWGGENRGDILLQINGLPAGEYEMTCYHNHWEPQKQKTRNRLDQPSKMPPMTGVRAIPLSVGKGGTGKGVTSLREAKDVKVTSETSDDKVATSVIRFKTDGSNDVVVIIDGGDDTYPDPARKGREGSKGILSAFKIDQIN